MKKNKPRKIQLIHGGHGRGMDNKKPRRVKHAHDRLIDKRIRREGKELIKEENS
jgi:hypothetical protein